MKLKSFLTVFRFEYRNLLRNKVFLVFTIVFAILIVVGLTIPSVIGALRRPDVMPNGPAADAPVVYVLDQTGMAGDLTFLNQALSDRVWQTAPSADETEMRRLIAAEERSALLIFRNPGHFVYLENRRSGFSQSDLALESVLTRYFQAQSLRQAGLSAEQVTALMTSPQIEYQEIAAEAGKSVIQTYLFTYLMVFLLYMTVMMYGQLVASSIASEKSNRAMEILITSTSPMSLMFGKVIGSGLAGLTQIAIWIAAAVLGYQINHQALSSIPVLGDLFRVPPQLIVFMLLFYLIGYFTYAFLYGALGSLVSRTEDLNTSILPVMFIIMAAIFVAFYSMGDPQSTVTKVASFLPLLAPMVMFVRMAMTSVPAWQLAVSIIGMLAVVFLIGGASSRIYRLGVLMYGKPPRLKEIWPLLRKSGG